MPESSNGNFARNQPQVENKVWLAPYYHRMEAWGFPVKAAKLFHFPSLQRGIRGWNQAFCELMGCRSRPCPVEEVDKRSSSLLWSHSWQTAASHGERAYHHGPGVGPRWLSVFWELLPRFLFLASGGLVVFYCHSDSLALLLNVARSKNSSPCVKRFHALCSREDWRHWSPEGITGKPASKYLKATPEISPPLSLIG